MGAVLSRWRKKATTDEILESLQTKIQALEESKKTNIEKQRRLIGSLILYSVLMYVVAALVFYFYYMPASWSDRLLYSSPMAVFPFLVWLMRKVLRWYFVKRISKNEAALEELKEKRKTILEEVMEKETYKKAKEILEKYDPERFKSLEGAGPRTPIQSPEGQELRQRQVGARTGPTPGPRMPMGRGCTDPSLMGTPLRPPGARPPGSQRNGTNQMFVTPAPAKGPPLPRPVIPRDRSVMDRFVEYLLGDGPQNRYALICKDCQSHNGMALREEFEYISFRCCYCYAVNPARKQRPFAPKLDTTASAARPRPISRQPTQESGSEESVDTAEGEPPESRESDASPDSTSSDQSSPGPDDSPTPEAKKKA